MQINYKMQENDTYRKRSGINDIFEIAEIKSN